MAFDEPLTSCFRSLARSSRGGLFPLCSHTALRWLAGSLLLSCSAGVRAYKLLRHTELEGNEGLFLYRFEMCSRCEMVYLINLAVADLGNSRFTLF